MFGRSSNFIVVAFNIQLILFHSSYFYNLQRALVGVVVVVLWTKEQQKCAMQFGDRKTEIANRSFFQFSTVAWKLFGRSFFLSFFFCVFAYEYWSIIKIGILTMACCILQILFEISREIKEHTQYTEYSAKHFNAQTFISKVCTARTESA